MKYYELLQHYKNANYKIVLNVGKNKTGNEKFVYNKGYNRKRDVVIDNIKDMYKEKRKGKNRSSVIGTTLVNIINSLPKLTNIFKSCKENLNKFDFKSTEKFYTEVLSIIDNSKIKNISNIEKYHQMINEVVCNPMIIQETTSEIVVLQELINQTDNTEFKQVCNVYKDIFILRNKNNILINDGELNIDIMTLTTKNLTKEEIESLIYNANINILQNYLEYLSDYIYDILEDNHFIITTFIDNFIYDFKTILSKGIEIQVYKNVVANIALYNDLENRYYTDLHKYLENTKDYTGIEFLKDIVFIFVNALYKDILQLAVFLDVFSKPILYNPLNLPKASIKFTEQDESDDECISKPCEYTYSISKLKEFIDVSMYHILLDNRKIIKCHNCGRYFISDIRNNEVFCGRIDPNDPKGRACKKIGIERKRYHKSDDPTRNLYKRICNRLHNNSEKYEKDELVIFRTEYKNYRKKLSLESNKYNYDKKYKNKLLMKWLQDYNKKLMKKYPSPKYKK